MSRLIRALLWLGIAGAGAYALGLVALARREHPSVIWFVIAAICFYALGYRFYSSFIAARVLELDNSHVTPAIRLNNGRDYVPTPRWITFGHHFAAIAGPGPLVGPVLAAQFGYLPSILWIVIGAVLGGCVQDFVILGCSLRRDGRSLGKMARDEIGPLGGFAALIGVLLIMIILIAVLGLVVVNAMKHSVWATSTVAATVPIAILVGIYMIYVRPGRIIEASLIGVGLILLAVIGGGYIKEFAWAAAFNFELNFHTDYIFCFHCNDRSVREIETGLASGVSLMMDAALVFGLALKRCNGSRRLPAASAVVALFRSRFRIAHRGHTIFKHRDSDRHARAGMYLLLWLVWLSAFFWRRPLFATIDGDPGGRSRSIMS
jgi:hypothetical protein